MSEGKGVVELIVRAIVGVVAVGAIVAAAVCVGTLNDVFGTDSIPGFDLLTETRGATGWIIFVAAAAIFIMLLFGLLRIAGRASTIVQAVGIVFSVLLGLGYLGGGVAAAIYTKDWDDLLSALAGTSSEGDRIRASLGAAAGLCFLSDVMLLVLVFVSILKK